MTVKNLGHDNHCRTFSYTIYPKWFGGDAQAREGLIELAKRTATWHGWIVAGITMTPDGFDSRGDRWIGTVDYREPVH